MVIALQTLGAIALVGPLSLQGPAGSSTASSTGTLTGSLLGTSAVAPEAQEAEETQETERIDVAALVRERRAREEAAYPVTTCELPADVELEIGGLCLVPVPKDVRLSDGPRIVAVTRRGEVWAIDGFAAQRPNPSASFTLVGEGLHEPLGLVAEPGGSLLTACRAELSRLVDSDGNGSYETVETIADDWHISGNYHEYNFGPAIGQDGSFWITTNKPFGAQPFGKVDWRGFALRILSDGSVKPMCAGLRSPAGIGRAPWGEIFYTDNQGEWCGASKLSLLVPGSYHGHPHGIESTLNEAWTWPKPTALPDGSTYAALAGSGKYPSLQMPSVWFPYDKMGRSPAGFVWDGTEGKFGPFAGQMFVADQYEAAVFRVDLERVRGHWQGACFRFRDGLSCGAIRLDWTPTGSLLVGETDRGWGSKGTTTVGIERIDWSGVTPFEIHTMRLLPDGSGFALRLTESASEATLGDAEGYSMISYTYEASERYGSDELDKKALRVVEAKPHADGKGVDLTIDGLRDGYVHELRVTGIRSVDGGKGLLHPAGYYTLVRRP